MIGRVNFKFNYGSQCSITGLLLGEMDFTSREVAVCLLGFALGAIGEEWNDHSTLSDPILYGLWNFAFMKLFLKEMTKLKTILRKIIKYGLIVSQQAIFNVISLIVISVT